MIRVSGVSVGSVSMSASSSWSPRGAVSDVECVSLVDVALEVDAAEDEEMDARDPFADDTDASRVSARPPRRSRGTRTYRVHSSWSAGSVMKAAISAVGAYTAAKLKMSRRTRQP